MNDKPFDAAIKDFISQVVHQGSTYQIEEMEKLYTPDQSILFFSRDGSINRSSRAQMLAEFTARRDSSSTNLTPSRFQYQRL